jgi:hypothetical protein
VLSREKFRNFNSQEIPLKIGELGRLSTGGNAVERMWIELAFQHAAKMRKRREDFKHPAGKRGRQWHQDTKSGKSYPQILELRAFVPWW